MNVEGEEDSVIVNCGEGNGVDEDLRGKIVENEDEAFNFYNQYAVNLGFSVRLGTKRYDKNGVMRTINFVCWKEGFRVDSDLEEKKTDRLDTRCGCKAFIRFSRMNDVWKVSHLETKHNHNFVSPEERQFLRSSRKISKAGVIKTLIDPDISRRKRYSYLADEIGQAEIGAKKMVINEQIESPQMKEKSPKTLLLNSLMRRAYNVISKGVEHEGASRLLSLKLTEMEKLIDKEVERSKDCNNEDIHDDDNEGPTLDPPRVSPKGEKRKRKPSVDEVKKKQPMILPKSNVPSHQILPQYNPVFISTWGSSYPNFSFTGVSAPMLQSGSFPSNQCFGQYPHLIQNLNTGFPSSQIGTGQQQH